MEINARKLITNADDFGLNKAITDAIIDSHLCGIITSTTLMANMDGAEYALKKAISLESLSVGIHFNLTEGKPICAPEKVDLLLDYNGLFKNNQEQRLNLTWGNSKEKIRQIRMELNAQLGKFFDCGLTPTHFDSHHHITGTPMAFRASLDEAIRNRLTRARATNVSFVRGNNNVSNLSVLLKNIKRSPKIFLHGANKGRLRAKGLKTPDTKLIPELVLPRQTNFKHQLLFALRNLKSGTTEISFHPGTDNAYKGDSEKTRKIRVRDLEILKSDEVKQLIEDLNINLIGYRDL